MRRRGARAAAVALIAATLIACAAMGCAAVLGVDEDRVSVAKFMCKCPGIGVKPEVCEGTVEDNLETAGEDARSVWLARFEKLKCDTECANAVLCLRTSPTCQAVGGFCETNNDCCDGEKCATDKGECTN